MSERDSEICEIEVLSEADLACVQGGASSVLGVQAVPRSQADGIGNTFHVDNPGNTPLRLWTSALASARGAIADALRR